MKKLFWSLLFLILAFANTAFGLEEKTTVKVGISNSAFSTFEHSSVTFILNGASSITDMSTSARKAVDPNSTVKITMQNSAFKITINNDSKEESMDGPIIITSSDKIGIDGLKRKGMPAYYRGMFELKSTKPEKFNIINVLDMQSYLKGVVPNEMPISFGIEALKAQAVAARNYANRPMTSNPNYDVCDSTACQVYYGANSETSISDKAVDETNGIYATYNNEIILALYSSTASGITEDYFNTFGNFTEDKPYLKSVADSEDLRKIKEENFFKKSYPSFDMNSPKYRWERKYSKEELEEVLSKTLVEQSKVGAVEPKLLNSSDFYGLKDIIVLKRGASGKALEIEIKTSSGTYKVKKELPIRRVLKQNNALLPSANFIVEKDGGKKIDLKEEAREEIDSKTSVEDKEEAIFKSAEDSKQSTTIKTHLKDKLTKKSPISFTFYGAGFGHGVGMSQYGAGYLSSYGIPYDNILKHYYTGIKIGTIPKTVSYNTFGITYSQEFYFDKNKNHIKQFEIAKSPLRKELSELTSKSKKCYLIIENNEKVSNIEFFINSNYFNPDIKSFKKKILKTEITKYLENGNNKIIFNPLKEADKRKHLTFYVVLGEEND